MAERWLYLCMSIACCDRITGRAFNILSVHVLDDFS